MIMGLPAPLKLNRIKEMRVKHAVGLGCEICSGAFPADLLEIHLLPNEGKQASPGPDLQREILVLCPICHRETHESKVSRADQKILVRSRTAGARKEIMAILGYHPEPYIPPEADLAAVFEDTRQFSTFFVNGAG